MMSAPTYESDIDVCGSQADTGDAALRRLSDNLDLRI